nr:hypothetical protein [uncultured Carboxylicivirga sp.]
MTGGLGFVKDGMNSQNRNRRMVNDLNDRHFKSSKPKSNFSRKYRETKKADPKTLEAIREKTKRERRRNLIKSLIIISISIIIVITIYFLPKLVEL